MTDWAKLAVPLLGIGFELDVFGISIYQFAGEKGAVEAMHIIGFLSYIIALVLILLVVFGEFKGNKVATISQICFSFAATLFLIVGLAVYGARVTQPSPYAATLITVSAVLSLVSGVFMCLILDDLF